MRILSGFELSDSGNGYFIARATGELAEKYPQAFQMGLSGAYLWDRMTSRDCSRAELIFELQNFYEDEIEISRIEADVDTLLSFLAQENLLIDG